MCFTFDLFDDWVCVKCVLPLTFLMTGCVYNVFDLCDELGVCAFSTRSLWIWSMHSKLVASCTWCWSSCQAASSLCSWREKESSWRTQPGQLCGWLKRKLCVLMVSVACGGQIEGKKITRFCSFYNSSIRGKFMGGLEVGEEGFSAVILFCDSVGYRTVSVSVIVLAIEQCLFLW